MGEGIKNCPFCGCLAWLHTDPRVFAGHTTGGQKGHRIECEGDCHAMTCWWHTKEEAIMNWNRRHTEGDPPEPIMIEVEAFYEAMLAASETRA